MGKTPKDASRFPSTPFLGSLEVKMADQVGRDLGKAAETMAENPQLDKYGGILVESQTRASAEAIADLGPTRHGLVSVERWEHIEGRLRDAFEKGVAEVKARICQ